MIPLKLEILRKWSTTPAPSGSSTWMLWNQAKPSAGITEPCANRV